MHVLKEESSEHLPLHTKLHFALDAGWNSGQKRCFVARKLEA